MLLRAMPASNLLQEVIGFGFVGTAFANLIG